MEDVALKVARALESLGVRYLVGGSVASSLRGEPRATNDIDLLVELTEAQVPQLAAALGPDFSVDEQSLCDAVRRRRSWNIFFLPLVTKIDLFIKRADAFDESELRRRQLVVIGPAGESLYVATAEDILVRKLAWFREGGEGSPAQWRDVLGILRVSGSTLDLAYARQWAEHLGVADLLARALTAT
jgi:hypothetical protein